MSWTHDLSPGERRQWDQFVADAREHTVKAMADSAFVMSLVPSGEPDIKFAVELGLAIMLGKPVIALALHGQPVPDGLRRVAHAVIEVDDFDTEAGQAELHRRLRPYLDALSGGEPS